MSRKRIPGGVVREMRADPRSALASDPQALTAWEDIRRPRSRSRLAKGGFPRGIHERQPCLFNRAKIAVEPGQSLLYQFVSGREVVSFV